MQRRDRVGSRSDETRNRLSLHDLGAATARREVMRRRSGQCRAPRLAVRPGRYRSRKALRSTTLPPPGADVPSTSAGDPVVTDRSSWVSSRTLPRPADRTVATCPASRSRGDDAATSPCLRPNPSLPHGRGAPAMSTPTTSGALHTRSRTPIAAPPTSWRSHTPSVSVTTAPSSDAAEVRQSGRLNPARSPTGHCNTMDRVVSDRPADRDLYLPPLERETP